MSATVASTWASIATTEPPRLGTWFAVGEAIELRGTVAHSTAMQNQQCGGRPGGDFRSIDLRRKRRLPVGHLARCGVAAELRETLSRSDGRTRSTGIDDLDLLHHPLIFMIENVAMHDRAARVI